MRPRFAVLLISSLLVSIPSRAQAPADPGRHYFVATNGNDAWSGALPEPNAAQSDGPFASLERARDAIRALRGEAPATGRATVAVRGGNYFLPRTLALTAADSRVTYIAVAGEKPVLIGGRPIGRFVADQGRILKAELDSQGFKGVYFRQLFFNGKRQTLARFPNVAPGQAPEAGYSYVPGERVPMNQDVPDESRRRLPVATADWHAWAHPEEGEVVVFPRYNWWNNIVRIASVDRGKHSINLSADASFSIRPGDRYYVRNLLEELDAPGEWYLDREHATLYFWPPGPMAGALVEAPTLERLVDIKGASEIALRGFTLECSEAGAVAMEDCTNCAIAGNLIRNVGGRADAEVSAVSIVGGGGDAVVGNDIFEVGSNAISLDGGDRKTLKPAGHFAENNHIAHPGVFYKQGAGIILLGVGNRASYNLIHDCPRFAILLKGNDQVIEYNHIHDVNLETSDTGAIYCRGADWTASRGSTIRYNFIHDSVGYGQENGKWVSHFFASGIYLDDQAANVEVLGNIVARASESLLHLHGAMNNVIENNILVNGGHEQLRLTGDPKEPTSDYTRLLPAMTQGYNDFIALPAWKKYPGFSVPPKDAVPLGNNRFVRNIVYYKNPTATFAKQYLIPAKSFTFDANVIFHFGQPLLTGLEPAQGREQWKAWQKLGFDTHSLIEDPLFTDADKDDYRLRWNSPAFKLGFKAIPIDKIGPYRDAVRASWPIEDVPVARPKGL